MNFSQVGFIKIATILVNVITIAGVLIYVGTLKSDFDKLKRSDADNTTLLESLDGIRTEVNSQSDKLTSIGKQAHNISLILASEHPERAIDALKYDLSTVIDVFENLEENVQQQPQQIAAPESMQIQGVSLGAVKVYEHINDDSITGDDESQEHKVDEGVDVEQQLEVVVEEEPAKIIPAKIISRAIPRYPNRALSTNIEGWVSVSFDISIRGLPENITILESQPTGTFDRAALKAVKKWRFSPARNEKTGLPVQSKFEPTKLEFKPS